MRAVTPFVSFAQNQEDVVLWRALRDVGTGFYVDVGATDPTVDSVTRAFYDRGWSGINIEPVEEYYERLVAERPRDLNLRVLAGAKPGMRTLHVVPGTGLSTVDPDFAARQSQKGRMVSLEMLPVVPLSVILQAHGDKPIHFLKVDVEGAERDVLEGIDLMTIRPWIVVVEATEPETQVQTQHLWEDLLFDRDYDFTLFDGLNRFYVAREHADLKERASMPPNYFDLFRRFSEHILSEQYEQASGEVQRLAAVERSYEALRSSLPDVHRLQAERDGLVRRVAALEAFRAEVMAAHEPALAGAARLGSELADAQAREAALSAELADARASRDAMAGALAHLRADALRVRREFAGSEALVSELRDRAAALAADVTALVAERLRLRERSVLLEARVSELQVWVARYRRRAHLRRPASPR